VLAYELKLGESLTFYQHYDPETGKTRDAYGIIRIGYFDTDMFIVNSFGGGKALIIDLSNQTVESATCYLQTTLASFFSRIGAYHVYINADSAKLFAKDEESQENLCSGCSEEVTNEGNCGNCGWEQE
jgi:hypothetical protein